MNDQEALLIGIKCERGSHKFFKKYGERFEDSEGKQVFLEFADEERAHLDLLMREYRALRERQAEAPPRAAGADAAGGEAPMIDLHTHTTASDGRCSPAELVARAAAAGVTVLSVTDHDTVDACAAGGAACADAGIAFVPGIEITAVRDEVDVHVLGYFIDPQSPALRAVSRRAAPAARRSRRPDDRAARRARHAARRRRHPAAGDRRPGQVDRPSGDRARARRRRAT